MPSVSLKYVLIFLTLVSTRNSFIEILILSPQTKAHKETGWSGSSPHTWGIQNPAPAKINTATVHPHIRGAYRLWRHAFSSWSGSSPHTWGIQLEGPRLGQRDRFIPTYVGHTDVKYDVASCINGSSPHTWGIHWTTVRKMAGFSHFSYDFTRKSYFVQGLVFFGVIGAEAFPTHRRGRNQCLPGAHGGSVRNL